ncbi:unnamed protein product [Alopecurus aequalis]
MERKKKGWFERIKRLFISEPKQKPKPDKKVKSKRWLVGKLKTQQSFALPAPEPVTDQVQIRQAQADDGMDALLRRGRELYAAALHEQQQQQNNSRGWDGSTLSKEEMGAMMRSREEAAMKRVRALQYASLQNEKIGIRRQPMSRDDMETLNQRWSWLEEWVGSQPFDKDVPVAHQSPCRDVAVDVVSHHHHPPPPRSRESLACLGDNEEDDEDYERRLGYSSRRSFVRMRRTPGRASDVDGLQPCSPAVAYPGYMASTASAKAKFRSMSTPKERFAVPSDAYSEQCFPSFADRLMSPIPSMSPMPSIASDIGFARSGRPPVAQRSPRIKGPMTPSRTRSRRSPSRHSFGSEAALHQMQMEQYTPVR